MTKENLTHEALRIAYETLTAQRTRIDERDAAQIRDRNNIGMDSHRIQLIIKQALDNIGNN